MRLRFASFAFCVVAAIVLSAHAEAVTMDLADVVGGGNGFGTGTEDTGIDPRTGDVVNDIQSVDNPGSRYNYNLVDSHDYIDGVFVPCGRGGARTEITSTGDEKQFKFADGGSWDNGIGYNPEYTPGQAGETNWRNPGTLRVKNTAMDMFESPHSGIGFHSNKGITFDLDAIRQVTGLKPTKYTAWVGVRYETEGWWPTPLDNSADIYHYVLLDGSVKYMSRSLGHRDNAVFIDIDITPEDRFLTLVGTSVSATHWPKRYSWDQGIIGDPTLVLTPEPATICLLGLGLSGLVAIQICRRRSWDG